MPSIHVTRRRILTAGSLTLAGLAGCLADDGPGDDDASPTASSPADTETDDGQSESSTTELSIADISVSDFVEYPLAGVHPHVHTRRETQYVVVSVDSSLDDGAVRERVGLGLDGEAMTLADRQPVPWESNTTDVAFAVSKGDQYDRGAVTDGETTLHSFSAATLERLNRPPRFRVSDLTVSPAEIPAGQQTTATVRATVENVGEGAGTFGASLKGNYLSGAATVTMALDAGATGELESATETVGDGDEATVRLDWGRDEWESGIPVRETETGTVTTASD